MGIDKVIVNVGKPELNAKLIYACTDQMNEIEWLV